MSVAERPCLGAACILTDGPFRVAGSSILSPLSTIVLGLLEHRL